MTKLEKIEFGDFQTPLELAEQVCRILSKKITRDHIIIEPTCGVGNFVMAALHLLQPRALYGFDINSSYINTLKKKIQKENIKNIVLETQDFFKRDWLGVVEKIPGDLLVLGNPPWVTSAAQGVFRGENLPNKSNIKNLLGLNAITGKANFDISEWIILEIMKWFREKNGIIAMLIKTSVARKTIQNAESRNVKIKMAVIYKFDSKHFFNVSVDACLMILEIDNKSKPCYDYRIYQNFQDDDYKISGIRDGIPVSNIALYEKYAPDLTEAHSVWRSGIKHDCAKVFELTKSNGKLINGFGEIVDLENDLVFPLMKGSEIGSEKGYSEKLILINQKKPNEETKLIRKNFPKTWDYLMKHSDKLDARSSVIYRKSPRFSIFGVGEYSFSPWKIAICSLYKRLNFQLISSIDGKPVMFDDTVYFSSFWNKNEALKALEIINKKEVKEYLESLIFWDDKRPIKVSILNKIPLQAKYSSKAAQHVLI